MFSYLQIFPQKKLKFNKLPYLHHLSGFFYSTFACEYNKNHKNTLLCCLVCLKAFVSLLWSVSKSITLCEGFGI